MTIEEIKAKLKRYRFIAGEISDLLDERERLRSLAEKDYTFAVLCSCIWCKYG